MSWVLFALVGGLAGATEVDSLTHRNEDFPNATEALNTEVNRRMNRARVRSNLLGNCNERVLYRQLGRELRAGILGAYMISPLENFSNYNPGVARRRTPKYESMYREIGLFESVPIALYPLGSLIRIDDHWIAGDKFSHFFNVGWSYYEIHYRSGAPVSEALRYGERTERGIWGLATTGIYSHADLSANLQGMRFWSRILGEDDILGADSEPYFVCEDDDWVLHRAFVWEDWVNASWDEGVNCNLYAPRFDEKVSNRTMDIDSDEEELLQCPVQRSACDQLRELYGDLTERLIYEGCRDSSDH